MVVEIACVLRMSIKMSTEERYGSLKSYVQGPKWAGAKELLFALSIRYHVELTILDHDKGWIRETIYFKIDGFESDINTFMAHLNASLEEYNRD